MTFLSKSRVIVQLVKRFVTKDECGQCREVNQAKRETLAAAIEGMRREQRLGFAMIGIFLTILSILIKTGVI